MKKKLSIIGIIVLTILLTFLISNNIYIKRQEDNKIKVFSNKVVQIKENLLKENIIQTKSIQGKLYIDDSVKIIKNIELVLYKDNDGQYEKVQIAYTNDNGNYKFSNLENGNYKIQLQKEDDYKTINDNLVIKIDDSSFIKNFDIQVMESDIFKAQITKYITQVILNVNGKESVYNFDKKNRVNIPVKNLYNLQGIIKYEFEVKNYKSKDGFVKVIKDTIPEGLSFDQTKNPDWIEKNGLIYNKSLSTELLKSGETKTISLVLDIDKTDEAKSYLNKVSITGELYHKVTFINIDEILSQMDVLDGDTTIEETPPEREGYKFTGWYTDKNLTTKFDFTEPITEDVEIYAGWIKKHNVNYIVNSTIYDTQVVLDNELAIKPKNDPIVEEYNFIGWYTDETYSEEFDFNTKITSDTNIYAKLERQIKSYKVTYILEGEEFASETLKSGALIEDKIVPQKESEEKNGKVSTYEFSGWFSDNEYNQLYDFKIGITSDTILYGKYVESLTCKNKSNVIIPTKEEIINKIQSKDSIINQIQQGYTTVDESIVSQNKMEVTTQNFRAILDENTNSYTLISYIGSNYNQIIIPDTINGVKVSTIDSILNNQEIGTVKISKSLEVIKGSSFANSSIKNLDFTSALNLTTITEGSFLESTIDDLDLGNAVNLTTINNSAFQKLKFKSINFNNSQSLVNITDGSFANATGEELHLGNSISLKNSDFVQRMIIKKSINFDNAISITSINQGFLSNKTINSVSFDNAIGLTTIKSGAFSNVTISDLSFANAISLTTIQSGAFSGGYRDTSNAEGGIYNLDFANAVNISEIQQGAFSGQLNVDVLDMSKLFNLTTLNSNAITNNKKIKKVIFGTAIEVIGQQSMFYNNIEQIDLSCAVNLTTISNMAFYQNSIKEEVIENMPSLTYLDLSAFGNNPLEKFTLLNLENLSNLLVSNPGSFSYQGASYPGYQVPEVSEFTIDNIGVTNLEFVIYYPFFTKVVIKNNKKLVDIGGTSSNGLFTDSSSVGSDQIGKLKEIIITNNENLENLGKILFQVDTNSIILSNLPNLKVIEDRAFYGSTRFVNELVITDFPKLTKIGDYAFFGTYNYLCRIESIILNNLPQLEYIGEYAFNVWGAQTLTLSKLPSLTTIKDYAFAGHRAEKVVLNSENVPSLTTLGNESFWPYSFWDNTNEQNRIKANLKEIELADLPNLNTIPTFFIGASGRMQNYIELEKYTLKNLPLVTELAIKYGFMGSTFASGFSKIKQINIIDMPKLDLSTHSSDFYDLNIEKIILENLPSTTIIPEYMFAENNFQYIDLTKMGNLQEIKNQAFRNKNTLKIVKLPETLTTIGQYAFDDGSGNPSAIECIEIQGDSSRFYGADSPISGKSYWEYISLPSTLSPSTCTIPQESNIEGTGLISNLLANIQGINTKVDGIRTYSLVLYKLDDGSLINNSSKYKLSMLTQSNYTDIGVYEDIENVGRYFISNESNDLISSINNKIYMTNIQPGVYKLVDVNDISKVLTFVIDNDGTITGNAKITNVSNVDNIMSSSEAEFITTIQTGVVKSSYIILLGLLSVIVVILFIINIRKNKEINEN